MKIKENKGFTQVDIIIALIILTIFTSTIAALFLNLSNEYKKAERKSEAANIAVTVIERVKQLDYAKIDKNLTNLSSLNNLLSNNDKISIEDGYTVSIAVLNYKDYSENKGKDIEDLVKKITVKVTYTVGNNQQEVKLETLVTTNKQL
jgi:type II secretory pathway pseudopilin PulG